MVLLQPLNVVFLLLYTAVCLLMLQCPAEVSKIFKSPKNLKCQSSRDAVCYSNGTAMVVSCTNAAGSLVATLSVSTGIGAAACKHFGAACVCIAAMKL